MKNCRLTHEHELGNDDASQETSDKFSTSYSI